MGKVCSNDAREWTNKLFYGDDLTWFKIHNDSTLRSMQIRRTQKKKKRKMFSSYEHSIFYPSHPQSTIIYASFSALKELLLAKLA